MRYIQGHIRNQTTLFPETPDDDITNDDPVRVVDGFVLCQGLEKVDAKMSSGVCAYNLERVIGIMDVKEMIKTTA